MIRFIESNIFLLIKKKVAYGEDGIPQLRYEFLAYSLWMSEIYLSRYLGVGSGGLIVGRCSPTNREVTIIDVLDAPLDSRREANVFVFGVEGLADTVIAYSNSGKDVLWCLGTWHSHLVPSGPSTRDKVTSHEIQGLMRGATVMLIRHPMGYEAIVAQGST